MNTVTVAGNLTRDPELRYTPTGQAVVKFGIAVNRFYTNRNGEKVEQTDFFGVEPNTQESGNSQLERYARPGPRLLSRVGGIGGT
jgi:single stranded DNA-binding protein